MSILNRLFGFRWSLYIVHDGKLAYAMHEHAVLKIAGYVMGRFEGGRTPVVPWELYLNFNRTHESIKLRPEHFTFDGENITPLLIKQIEAIDPGWMVKGGEPIFEDASTKKRLKIRNASLVRSSADFQAVLDSIGKPENLTFFAIMDMIFGAR